MALIEKFLSSLWSQLESDPSWALAMSEEQMALARTAIERAVVSLIYTHAMYPNGEVDVHRDQVIKVDQYVQYQFYQETFAVSVFV